MSEKNGEVGGVGDEVAEKEFDARESSSAMSRCLLGAWKRWLKDGGEPCENRKRDGALVGRRTDMPSSPAPRTRIECCMTSSEP